MTLGQGQKIDFSHFSDHFLEFNQTFKSDTILHLLFIFCQLQTQRLQKIQLPTKHL
jgi:hypothetical protein